MTMSDVISLRLDDREMDILQRVAEEEPDRSAAARALIQDGWKFIILQRYREGRISTGKAARELGLPISEFVDLLRQLGIQSPVSYDDFLEGEGDLEELWG